MTEGKAVSADNVASYVSKGEEADTIARMGLLAAMYVTEAEKVKLYPIQGHITY